MIGKTLSHYTILEELGRGGMGIVYKAEDTNLSRVVAVKVLPTHLVSAEDQARFRREAQSAASLNHPNIATIHDFGETDDGQAFLVMELIEGEPLSDRIGAGGLDAATAVDFATQIASGLQAAHNKGIVHRDVKPSNMMLTEDGRVKILDFGLAKMTGGVDITKTGLTVGTMSYMSPEQVQNDPVDERTDLWSLGVLFYEMLMGARPFEGVYDAAIIYGIVNQDVELENDCIPEALRPVLSRLLEKNQEKRFGSATELLAALGEEVQAPVGPIGSTVEQLPSVSTIRMPTVSGKTMSKWMVPVAAVVAVLLAVVIWRSLVPASVPKVGVMYIDNATPNERLGEQVGYLLYRNLLQAEGVIEVVSRSHLAGILRQQFGTEVLGIDASTATPIARQAGISQMIWGTATLPAAELVFDVELSDVESGVVIQAVSATAGSSADEDVFNAVNEMTTGILRGLGVIGSDQNGPRVQDVMTESFSAYELFEKGQYEAENWRFDEAVAYYESAIAIDSTFFAAYLEAALASSTFSLVPLDPLDQPLHFIRGASRYLSHATEKEEDVYDALESYLSFSEAGEEGQDFRTLADKYPEDKNLQLLAGNYSFGPAGLPYLERLLNLDPAFADGYLLKAYIELHNGQTENAITSITRNRSLQPENYNSLDSVWEILTSAGRFDEAIRILDEALEGHPRWVFIHRDKAYTKAVANDTTGMAALIDSVYHHPFRGISYSPQFIESNIQLALGKWNEGASLSSERALAVRQSGSDSALLFALRDHAAILHARGLHEEAENVLEEAVDLSWEEFTPDFNPYPVIAAYQNGVGYADAGDRSRLTQAIATIDVALNATGMDSRHRSYRHLLAANLAVLDGDRAIASQELEKAHSMYTTSSHYFRVSAQIAALNGDMENALSYYHKAEYFIDSRNFQIPAYPSFFIDHAVVPYEVARLFDDLGDRDEAVRRYEAALETWESTGADFLYIDVVRNRLQEMNRDS